MVRPIRRRWCQPPIAEKFWKAIIYIRQQKQIPNNERICRYMMREHEMTKSECETELDYAVKDGLVMNYKMIGSKGVKTGIEQEGYKLPESDFSVSELGSHDWYCFECHDTGEVLQCSDCWRVYHTSCTGEDWSGVTFKCTLCKEIDASKRKGKISRKEINKLLYYVVKRLKEKTKELHRMGSELEDQRFHKFLFMLMDLNTMEQKTKDRMYRYLPEFLGDAKTVLHNTKLIYGAKHELSKLADAVMVDCRYDLAEIRQCKDCYYFSNAKPKNWFAEPCSPPHELVWAKQKGFSHWPAKVMKIEGNMYDVRFFGALHQRANLPKTAIKPISLSVREIGAKRTQGFIKSCEELQRHQALCARALQQQEDGEEDEESDEAPDLTFHAAGSPQPTPDSPQPKREKNRVNSMEISSSVTSIPEKPVATPESSLVTSSEDKVSASYPAKRLHVQTQTSKKLAHGKSRSAQTEPVDDSEATPAEPAGSIPAGKNCDCDKKYNKMLKDQREKQQRKLNDEKERGLQELSDRLKKDFEQDKQQAVSRAVSKNQREIEIAKRQTEERCKIEYMEEMKKLAQKHKEAISATKKKQWCYLCESEATYHCCWNTSYCSTKCQHDHWQKEHKRVCRRKR
ncbi:unnamed protein product [Owenia fusiformis]|nr:unnamed protein product [Owenia fusiformis]